MTREDKVDYFHHFLENRPVGRIDQRKGRYTFTYKWDGYEWLIMAHHSSALPPGEQLAERAYPFVLGVSLLPCAMRMVELPATILSHISMGQ